MNKLLSPPLLFRLAAMLAVVLLIAGIALSEASASIQADNYSISWYTFDGGGGISSSPAYTVMGTIGQPDAGSQSGTGYDLTGGFWAWVAALMENYLPLILRP